MLITSVTAVDGTCLLDNNVTETIGKFVVRTINETSSQDYTLREFVVTKETKEGHTEERKIYHFHFQVTTRGSIALLQTYLLNK